MIQSREQWNARPWTSYTVLDWNKVTSFITHYSGADRSQTPRSIQDYCMDDKGHSDVDYNELERGGIVYMGRGDHVGGHTFENNSTSYGLCMIGEDGDMTDADKTAIRNRYEYACGRAGRRLNMWGHRDAPGNSSTSCPGDQVEAWIKAGMPYPSTVKKVIDMFYISYKGDPSGAVYVSDGFKYRHIKGITPAYQQLQQVTPYIQAESLVDMENVAGKPATDDAVGTVTFTIPSTVVTAPVDPA